MTPPTIGAAIRFITSAPAPWENMMGMSPARITETVMIFGRILFTAPCMMLSRRSSIVFIRPSFRHWS